MTYIKDKTAGAVLPATHERPKQAAAQTGQTLTPREH